MPILETRRVRYWKPSQTPFSYMLLRGVPKASPDLGAVVAFRQRTFVYDGGEFKIFDEIEHF